MPTDLNSSGSAWQLNDSPSSGASGVSKPQNDAKSFTPGGNISDEREGNRLNELLHDTPVNNRRRKYNDNEMQQLMEEHNKKQKIMLDSVIENYELQIQDQSEEFNGLKNLAYSSLETLDIIKNETIQLMSMYKNDAVKLYQIMFDDHVNSGSDVNTQHVEEEAGGVGGAQEYSP